MNSSQLHIYYIIFGRRSTLEFQSAWKLVINLLCIPRAFGYHFKWEHTGENTNGYKYNCSRMYACDFAWRNIDLHATRSMMRIELEGNVSFEPGSVKMFMDFMKAMHLRIIRFGQPKLEFSVSNRMQKSYHHLFAVFAQTIRHDDRGCSYASFSLIYLICFTYFVLV